MSPSQLASYESAFSRLSRRDLLALAGKLIDLAREREAEPVIAPSDLSEFYGAVHFSQDGLEYQLQIRSERT